MAEKQNQLKSIWGNWWEPIRKWDYPSWLLYELSFRFSQYSTATHNYIEEILSQTIAAFSAAIVFIICTIFLTVPACFILSKFFTAENLTKMAFEEKIKSYF